MMPKIRETIFTVEGRGPFPFDMLRYDQCWPVSEGHDSPKLGGDYGAELRRVVLKTNANMAPTPARWDSFCWTVVGEGELRDPAKHPTPLRRS
jgi:hypothetical protein